MKPINNPIYETPTNASLAWLVRCLVFASILSLGSGLYAVDPRQVELFDFDWRFHAGDLTGAEA